MVEMYLMVLKLRGFFFRRLIAVTGKARTNWCYVYLWLVLHARQTRPITTASRSVRLARHDQYMIMIKATETDGCNLSISSNALASDLQDCDHSNMLWKRSLHSFKSNVNCNQLN